MRVLQIISSIDRKFGGPTSAFAGLCEAQARAGMDVTALASRERDDDLGAGTAMAAAGVRFRAAGSYLRRTGGRREQAAAVAAAVAAADVVHVHGLWEPIQHAAAVAARRAGVPYVFCPNGMFTEWSLAQGRLKKWLYLRLRLRRDLRGAAAMHYSSELERQHSPDVGTPAVVEPNGLDFSEFADLPARGTFRAAHPCVGAGGRPVIVFLGRIHPGKGLEHLVPAVGRLARRGVDAQLLVVGPDSGGFRATVERAAAEHGVADRVVFTGMAKGRERIEALVDADLFCLPSDHENFGVSVAEALAAGLPAVVSPDVGIAPDLVAAGAGSAVSRDPDALADELARWLGDGDLRRRAGAAGAAFVRERYDWRHIAARWAGHYERMIAAARGR